MKYARDTRPNGASTQSADVLVEALPWIKNITGKTVVIKYGGSAMVDEKLRADVMSDIVLLKIIGVNPVIVHGGGHAITEAMERFQLPVEFKDGQRVTTDEAMDVVRTVLMGKVNQELIEAMNEHGNLAVGVSGNDAGTIVAEQADAELGRVGRITRINSMLHRRLGGGRLHPRGGLHRPGRGRRLLQRERRHGGRPHRRRHRRAQGDLPHGRGRALRGLPGQRLAHLEPHPVRGAVHGGEQRGVHRHDPQAALVHPRPQRGRVSGAHHQRDHAACIAFGAAARARGVGTTMHSTEEACKFDAHPLGNFASKLSENRPRPALDARINQERWPL